MKKTRFPICVGLLAFVALQASETLAQADEPAQPPPAATPAPRDTAGTHNTKAITIISQSDTLFGEPSNTPASEFRAWGTDLTYTPLFQFRPKGMLLQGDFMLALRGEEVTPFPVDRDGGRFTAGTTLAPQFRVGLRFDSGTALQKVLLHAEYEHDLPTGYLTRNTPIEGSELPGSVPIDSQLRKLFGRISLGPYLHAGGGFMTNQFGLGLLANDGATGNWVPGSARFADNRGGDRVLRGFLGTGPITPAAITAFFAVDQVQADDVMLPGDEAIQIIGTVSAGAGKPWGAGIFVVHRWQDTQDGERTEVTVIDATARYKHRTDSMTLSLEGELAFVTGETTLGPTLEFPVHDVFQIGGALRAAARFAHGGAVVDFLYASGDSNLDDKTQTAFRADPNFETGLLLFRQVLAAQTGRATVTAGDLDLVGVPSPGLERVPTRGSPTNTIAVFPRGYFRPVDGLEVYGGPLLAWSATPLADPLNTRVGGGTPHNALGGESGNMLGVEVDIGVRFRTLLRGTELTVGVEGAGFLPGDAFTTPDGNTMGGVLGGRALFQYRL